MAKKIKLTESQIEMLQSMEKSLTKKTFKITEEQARMLAESIPNRGDISDILIFKSPRGFYLGRSQMNQVLNKHYPYSIDSSYYDTGKEVCGAYTRGMYNKEIQEGSLVESGVGTEIIGDPNEVCAIGEDNSALKNPFPAAKKVSKNFKTAMKSHPERIKTEGQMNEGMVVEILEFAQHVIQFLKEVLTDPSSDGLSPFWRDLGISKGELLSAMADIGLIGAVVVQGVRKYEVYKKNFKKNIIKLYKFLTTMDDDDTDFEKPQPKGNRFKDPNDPRAKREAVVGLGDDIELEEDNYPAGAANDSNAPWNQKEPTMSSPNQPQSIEFEVIFFDGEHAFLVKDGKKYVYHVDSAERDDYADYAEREGETDYDEDGPYMSYSGDFEIDGEVIERFINDNLGNLSFGKGLDDYEAGMDVVEIDRELRYDLTDLIKYAKDKEGFIAALAPIGGMEETTTAGSVGGQFTTKMGTGNLPIGKAMGSNVEDEMQKLDEEGIANSGQYATPGFQSSEFFGNKGKKGKAPVNKNEPPKFVKGGKKVKPKDKCKEFPYCNAGPDAIEIGESELYEAISKETGKSIDEVKGIVANWKANKG